jgi:hypothetical protein
VTVADLLAGGVSSDLAASSVEELMRRQASDAEMTAFRASVARELAGGADAAAAVRSSMRDVVKGLDGPALLPTVRKPPESVRPGETSSQDVDQSTAGAAAAVLSEYSVRSVC